MKTDSTSLDNISGDFSVALWTATCHPDRTLRRQLLAQLDDWIMEGGPLFSYDDITMALCDVEGTTVEPFVLTEPGLSAAVRFVQAAFSKRMKQRRVRLVSEETLGNMGGFVLTDNLKGYYVERFALGKNTKMPKSGWYLAPAEMDRELKNRQAVGQTPIKTSCSIDESGYLIKILLPEKVMAKILEVFIGNQTHRPTADKIKELEVLREQAAKGNYNLPLHHVITRMVSSIESSSFVLNSRMPFTKLGLLVSYKEPNLCIRPGSPESTLRLSALMAQHATLVIGATEGIRPKQLRPTPLPPLIDDNRANERIYVGLEPLLEDETYFPSTMSLNLTGSEFSNWISPDIRSCFTLPVKDRLNIARWALPVEDWFNEDFLRLL